MTSRISGKTRLIGLFGTPVSHSKSPVLQNTLFRAMGLDYAYLAFDVPEARAADVAAAVRNLNMRGANITMPLKRAIIPHLDALSPAAEMCGAVNVIVNEDGRLTGHISDGDGFLLSLQEAGVNWRGQTITLIGAGGAGLAVAIAAALQGAAKVQLLNRSDGFYDAAQKRLELIGDKLPCPVALYDLDEPTQVRSCIEVSQILINATPIGMEDTIDRSPLPDLRLLRPDLAVCDLIYIPRQTRFLREAQACGCQTVSGIGMQMYQAAPAFRLWTGVDMDITIARKALFQKDAQ